MGRHTKLPSLSAYCTHCDVRLCQTGCSLLNCNVLGGGGGGGGAGGGGGGGGGGGPRGKRGKGARRFIFFVKKCQ